MPNVWKPHEGAQERFHECGAYEVLFGGSRGPGKTECLLREAIRQTGKSNYRAIIFRRTYPRLGEIVDRSHKYYGKMGAIFSGKDVQTNLPAWTWPSGAKICFGHIQHEKDKWNYHGKEFHYIGFDEIAEFTESQYLFCMSSNRTSDKEIKCYIRCTANPGGVGHGWVKRRWIESCKPGMVHWFKNVDGDDLEVDRTDTHALSRAFVPATLFDNPSIIENDPNYLKRLEQLPEAEKRAFLYGDWDVFQGQFFKSFRKTIHVQEREVIADYRKFISLDYGYAAPSSIGWWFTDFSGKLHRYRELYQEGLTYEKLGRMIRELTPAVERIDYLVADPAIWGDRARHKESFQGESGAETLQKELSGFCSVIQADNNRITGWNRLRTLMEPKKDKDGNFYSDFTISPKCKDWIRTVPNLVHDELNVEDINTDGEDHAGDDTRYAVMTRPQASREAEVRSVDPAFPMAIELIHGEKKKGIWG